MPAKMCKKRRRGLQRVRRENFLKGRKNKGNSIILFFLFNFFSLFYFFLCVYVGGKKRRRRGETFPRAHSGQPLFFCFSWAAIPVCCKVIWGKKKKKKGFFYISGVRRKFKKMKKGGGVQVFFLKGRMKKDFFCSSCEGEKESGILRTKRAVT